MSRSQTLGKELPLAFRSILVSLLSAQRSGLRLDSVLFTVNVFSLLLSSPSRRFLQVFTWHFSRQCRYLPWYELHSSGITMLPSLPPRKKCEPRPGRAIPLYPALDESDDRAFQTSSNWRVYQNSTCTLLSWSSHNLWKDTSSWLPYPKSSRPQGGFSCYFSSSRAFATVPSRLAQADEVVHLDLIRTTIRCSS